MWFVAHPKQMRDWKGEPPNLYDISGSAHFINKADCGVVVHRNRDPDKGMDWAQGSYQAAPVLVACAFSRAAAASAPKPS